MYFVLLIILNLVLILNYERISKFINLYDIPDEKRKIHAEPVASIGGFLILTNLFFFLVYVNYKYFFLNFNFEYGNHLEFNLFFLFYLILFLFGYLDDKYKLSPNFKLFFFFLLTTTCLLLSKVLIVKTLHFSFLNKSIDLKSLSFFFSVLSLVLFLNALNMFDGINLQVSIYSINIFLLFIFREIFVEISFVMIFSLIFFSYLNKNNKCFLGNNGSLSIAFIIAYLFMKSQTSPNPFYADEIFLAMQIPGIDMLRLVIQRILNKKHPFHPDQNHIHHILMRSLGFAKTLLVVSGLIVIPNILSVLYGNTHYYIIITFIIYFLLIFWFKKDKVKKII